MIEGGVSISSPRLVCFVFFPRHASPTRCSFCSLYIVEFHALVCTCAFIFRQGLGDGHTGRGLAEYFLVYVYYVVRVLGRFGRVFMFDSASVGWQIIIIVLWIVVSGISF